MQLYLQRSESSIGHTESCLAVESVRICLSWTPGAECVPLALHRRDSQHSRSSRSSHEGERDLCKGQTKTLALSTHLQCRTPRN